MSFKTHEEYLKYYRAYFKKRRVIFKAKGFCMNCCKNPVKSGNVSCEKCLLEKRLCASFHSTTKHIKEYKKILLKQNGLCAICRKEMTKIKIDHKHGTDKIRGLLCNSCNVAIGMLKESKEILESAIKYLSF